jgi:hypothetical protein
MSARARTVWPVLAEGPCCRCGIFYCWILDRKVASSALGAFFRHAVLAGYSPPGGSFSLQLLSRPALCSFPFLVVPRKGTMVLLEAVLGYASSPLAAIQVHPSKEGICGVRGLAHLWASITQSQKG